MIGAMRRLQSGTNDVTVRCRTHPSNDRVSVKNDCVKFRYALTFVPNASANPCAEPNSTMAQMTKKTPILDAANSTVPSRMRKRGMKCRYLKILIHVRNALLHKHAQQTTCEQCLTTCRRETRATLCATYNALMFLAVREKSTGVRRSMYSFELATSESGSARNARSR